MTWLWMKEAIINEFRNESGSIAKKRERSQTWWANLTIDPPPHVNAHADDGCRDSGDVNESLALAGADGCCEAHLAQA